MKAYLLFAACAALILSCQPETPPEPGPPPGKGPGKAPAESPDDWVTDAEASDFERTASYDQTMEFLLRLQKRIPEMRLTSFGKTAQGRDLPLVILSKDRAFTPEAAGRTGRPIVLIQSGIHPGEIDGKEACLMILRDLLLGKDRWILDAAIVLIVPIYNLDGHENTTSFFRLAQDGPSNMGFRVTSARLDLNRDHVKLRSPASQALIRLVNDWRPHMHVDNHVTDGCDHDWTLTYAWSEAPKLPGSVDGWMKEHMHGVLDEVRDKGHRTGPYVGLEDPKDPQKGFSTAITSARLSTGYFPLRNRPSILVEMHSYKPFKQRVIANRDFLVALLRKIGEAGPALVDAVEQSEEHTVELGRPDAPASEVVVIWKKSPESHTVKLPLYAYRTVTSLVTGEPLVLYERGKVEEIEVPWFHKVMPEKTLPRPRGYLVLAGWPQIDRLLSTHGLRLERLAEPAELEVVTMRLSNAKTDEKSYQGELRMTVEVSRQSETMTFPEGTLWIPADQPDFELAVQLLEPEAPDSLVSWGMLRSAMERMTWIGSRELEPLVEEMLEDPETRAEWEAALEDKALASDPKARHMWWFRRMPTWDDHIGLHPAMRVMSAPNIVTKPWKP